MLISPITGFQPIAPIQTFTDAAAESQPEGGFQGVLDSVISSVEDTQARADVVSQLAAVGKADPVDVLTATTEAQLMLQTATVVRNRAVEAFNEIMRMQV
jgi:flagellar hook-basal body complex protein FliE